MKRRWFLLAPAAAAALGVEELYRYTFCREGSRLLAPFLDKKGHEDAYYRWRDAAAERLRRTPCERMEIRSDRGERLRGWYFPLGGEGRRIAFIVHGYRSNHAETAGVWLDFYRKRGFHLFDPLERMVDGLFAEDVLAGADRFDGQRRVLVSGGADEDRIDAGIVQDLVIVLRDLLHACIFQPRGDLGFHVRIGNGEDTSLGHAGHDALHVDLADAASSDDANIDHIDVYSFSSVMLRIILSLAYSP